MSRLPGVQKCYVIFSGVHWEHIGTQKWYYSRVRFSRRLFLAGNIADLRRRGLCILYLFMKQGEPISFLLKCSLFPAWKLLVEYEEKNMNNEYRNKLKSETRAVGSGECKIGIDYWDVFPSRNWCGNYYKETHSKANEQAYYSYIIWRVYDVDNVHIIKKCWNK